MDTFLYCMTINVADGSSNDTMNVFITTSNVFNTSLCAQLVNTFHNDITCPGWNTYNYDAVTRYTNHYTRADILKTFFIPIYWLLCIIDPTMETLYVVDSLRQHNLNVIQNIRM
jgi:Ulp1 family protease